MNDRLQTLADSVAGPLLLTHGPHVRWACGFSGSNGWLLIQDDGVHLLTDGRYRDQAHRQVGSNAQVVVTADPLERPAIAWRVSLLLMRRTFKLP